MLCANNVLFLGRGARPGWPASGVEKAGAAGVLLSLSAELGPRFLGFFSGRVKAASGPRLHAEPRATLQPCRRDCLSFVATAVEIAVSARQAHLVFGFLYPESSTWRGNGSARKRRCGGLLEQLERHEKEAQPEPVKEEKGWESRREMRREERENAADNNGRKGAAPDDTYSLRRKNVVDAVWRQFLFSLFPTAQPGLCLRAPTASDWRCAVSDSGGQRARAAKRRWAERARKKFRVDSRLCGENNAATFSLLLFCSL